MKCFSFKYVRNFPTQLGRFAKFETHEVLSFFEILNSFDLLGKFKENEKYPFIEQERLQEQIKKDIFSVYYVLQLTNALILKFM